MGPDFWDLIGPIASVFSNQIQLELFRFLLGNLKPPKSLILGAFSEPIQGLSIHHLTKQIPQKEPHKKSP
jgi:hypothetical protein